MIWYTCCQVESIQMGHHYLIHVQPYKLLSVGLLMIRQSNVWEIGSWFGYMPNFWNLDVKGGENLQIYKQMDSFYEASVDVMGTSKVLSCQYQLDMLVSNNISGSAEFQLVAELWTHKFWLPWWRGFKLFFSMTNR